MYVTLEVAKNSLYKRRRSPSIRQKVLDYLGEIPHFLRQEPRVVLARQLGTPNFEFLRFTEKTSNVGLKPILIEYAGDKFCSKNRDKLSLGKMTFFHGKGRRNGDRITCRRIIDFNKYDGKPLREVKTLWQEGFVDFHHRLLRQNSPGIVTMDVTEWLCKMGGDPTLFWPRLLALFICHGILLDNFHTEGREAEFTRRVLRPALQETEKRFGLKPLVVPLVPVASEQNPYWSWYPELFEGEVRSLTSVQGDKKREPGTRVSI